MGQGTSITQKTCDYELKISKKSAEQKNIKVFEISRAGDYPLSAFYLTLKIDDKLTLPLEVIYQSAKVWGPSGEPRDLSTIDASGKRHVSASRQAKKDANLMRNRQQEGIRLKSFIIKIGEYQQDFPIEPDHDAFYNWIYILTLRQHEHLYKHVKEMSPLARRRKRDRFQ